MRIQNPQVCARISQNENHLKTLPAARARTHKTKQNKGKKKKDTKSHNTIPRELSVALGSVRSEAAATTLPRNHKQITSPGTFCRVVSVVEHEDDVSIQ